mmetsp:Transcript_93579/g.165566  ORF Transcript_93579/g.165566 Transcript_93579/m.165566 type:complete len:324 (+) Transcript_93579:77-1048(+)
MTCQSHIALVIILTLGVTSDAMSNVDLGMCSTGDACRVDSTSDQVDMMQRALKVQMELQTEHPVSTSVTGKKAPIPKIIMQTAKDRNRSDPETWLKYNPGWEYIFLDDAAAMEFLRSVDEIHASNFDLIIPGAIKADYLRLVWLATKGGVYIDADNEPDALDHYLNGTDLVLAKQQYEVNCTSAVHNAFMVAPPSSPLIVRMLNLSMQNIAIRKRPRWGGQSCYEVAGPTVIARVLKESVPNHCSQQQFKCKARHDDSEACNFEKGAVYETEDRERVKILKEGEEKVLTRKFYDGSPYGKQCDRGLFYKDTPEWTPESQNQSG